jgi:hypothetical protein
MSREITPTREFAVDCGSLNSQIFAVERLEESEPGTESIFLADDTKNDTKKLDFVLRS